MLIKCSYCGTVYDIDETRKCPNCKAENEKNEKIEQYIEQQNYAENIRIQSQIEQEKYKTDIQKFQAQQEYLETERMRARVNTEKQTHKEAKTVRMIIWGVFILFIVGIIAAIGIGVVSTFMEDVKFYMGDDDTTSIVETEPEIIETPTTVNFGESANLIEYSVICDSYEEYYYRWAKPKDGYKYMRIHLVITNNTDSEIELPDEILCNYKKDGYDMQANGYTIDSNDLGTKLRVKHLQKRSSADGWLYYEVPENSDLVLYYGDYITINISKDNITKE